MRSFVVFSVLMFLASASSFSQARHSHKHKHNQQVSWASAAAYIKSAENAKSELSLSEFPLSNAAKPGLTMPAMGLGTGYYSMVNHGYNIYPECGDEVHPANAPPGPASPGCGDNTYQSVRQWLSIGGRRLDCSNSYYNEKSVQRAILDSGVNRSDLFILSKVGPSLPLGYQDTLQQVQDILTDFNTDYIDLILIHQPAIDDVPYAHSTDPYCIHSHESYNEALCRLSTWKALVELWNTGKILSIGVSNYNITHIQEIIDSGYELPSVNQVSLHPYNYRSSRKDLHEFCNKYNILLNAYSPLGALDVHQFPPGSGLSPTLLLDPIIISLSEKYNRSPAQIILRWIYQLGIPTNPRSMNVSHMNENLSVGSFELSPEDMTVITNLPQV